jgi:hypothetical protein
LRLFVGARLLVAAGDPEEKASLKPDASDEEQANALLLACCYQEAYV